MAAVWWGPVLWRCPGETPAELRFRGRRCAGEVEARRVAERLPQLFQRYRFADGVEIDIHTWPPPQPPIITIRAPQLAPGRVIIVPRPAVWVQRGFVLYPASDDSPCGWGLPFDPVGDDPYARTNLRPGLDVTRWTAGGWLGQVLLTRVPDAGYPSVQGGRVTSPLLFHLEYGPRPPGELDEGVLPVPLPPDPADTGYTAYRIEFEDYRAQQVGLSADALAVLKAIKRGIAERIATLRDDAGVEPLTLPVRGYYDSAQALAEQIVAAQVLGHYSAAFDPTWRVPDDRTTRDGLSVFIDHADADDRNVATNAGEAITAQTNSPPTQIGTDPDGRPIYDIASGGPAMTVDAAADAFEADPIDAAMLTNVRWNTGPGGSAALLVGVRDNVAAAHVVQRDQWIGCGNVAWHSSDPQVPALSWFGPQAVNFGYETMPVTPIDAPSPPNQANIEAWQPHTLDRTTLRDESGYFWFRYVVSDPAVPEDSWHTQPLFDSRIFCRGRAIAVAPRGGFVMAAALHATETGHRLVALVHDDDDQAEVGLRREYGLTAYLRVWWCDIPHLSQLLANPEVVIRGVRGEANTYPWDDPNDPYAWQGGQLVDVGTSNGTDRDLLNYASRWEFDGAGRRAVCTRVWGTYPQSYRMAGLGGYAAEIDWFNGLNPWVYDALNSTPRPGVLVLDIEADGTATKTWLGMNADAAIAYDGLDRPLPRIPVPVPVGGIYVYEGAPNVGTITDLIAAGFDANDQLSFALVGGTDFSLESPIDWDRPANYHTYYYGVVDSLNLSITDVADTMIEYGQVAIKPGKDDLPIVVRGGGLLVMDLRLRATISVGTVPRFLREQFEPGSVCRPNPAWQVCWIGTDLPFFRVDGRVGDAVVFGTWHPNPDAQITLDLYLCGNAQGGVPGRQARVTDSLLASFARRGNEWVMSYVLLPQLGARFAGPPSGTCSTVTNPTYGVVFQNACTPRFPDLIALDYGQFQCMGAGGASSFGSLDAIATLTQTPGERPRLLQARVV